MNQVTVLLMHRHTCQIFKCRIDFRPRWENVPRYIVIYNCLTR